MNGFLFLTMAVAVALGVFGFSLLVAAARTGRDYDRLVAERFGTPLEESEGDPTGTDRGASGLDLARGAETGVDDDFATFAEYGGVEFSERVRR